MCPSVILDDWIYEGLARSYVSLENAVIPAITSEYGALGYVYLGSRRRCSWYAVVWLALALARGVEGHESLCIYRLVGAGFQVLVIRETYEIHRAETVSEAIKPEGW